MPSDRRASGFRPVGSVAPERLGLPERRATELRLSSAWADCVGTVLAERTQALGVRRGTLEILLTEPAWVETVSELLPGLAARLARAEPRLRIRACRLTVEGTEGTSRESRRFELRPQDGHELPSPPATTAPPDRPAPSDVSADDGADRLQRVAERYLERAGDRPPPQKP